MIPIEMKRALTSKGMIAALSVGLVLALGEFFTYSWPDGTSPAFEAWRSGAFNAYPPSVFSDWMGGTPGSLFSGIYYYLMPLLACLPHAASYFTDCQSGYAENVLNRTSMRRYLAAKILATAASAGIVCIAPLIVNFMLTTLVLPILTPEAAAGVFAIPPQALGADIFYSAPFIYVGGFTILAFISAALTGLSGLALSFAMPNRFMVLIAPFLCSVILAFATDSFKQFAAYNPIKVASFGLEATLTADGLALMLAVWILLVSLGIFLSARYTRSLIR